MGSWNETCGVSHLPIQAGEEIVVIPLSAWVYTDKVLHPRVTEIDKNYKPLYFAVKGLYNAYGGIENIEPDIKLVEHLNRLNIHKQEEEDGSLPFTGEYFPVVFSENDNVLFEKQFYQLLSNPDEYVISTGTRGKYRLDFMIIRRDIYDFLIERVAKRVPNNKENTLQNVVEETLSGEFISTYNSFIPKNDNSPYKTVYCAKNALENIFGNYAHLAKLADDYCNGEYAEFKPKFTELILFSNVLNLLRKGWLCHTSGRGNQEYELQLHKDLSEFILQIIADKQAEWRSENTNELCLEESIYF